MDRRTRFIIFIILTVVLFGLVGWFIVWPTLRPLIPATFLAQQPPALPTPNPPVTPQGSGGNSTDPSVPPTGGVASFDPTPSPDAFIIADLERRAGVLAERVESGSSEDGFTNYDDAMLDASPTLAASFQSMKTAMKKAHPAAGPSYVVTARRLVEQGESDQITGTTFNVSVQMQASVRTSGNVSTEYREAIVTFTQTGQEWIASGYTVKAFVPE